MPVAKANADPIDELAAALMWVTDDESATLAYAMAATELNVVTRETIRELVLLRLWAIGGNPWKINPNWVAPTGP